PGWPMSSVSIMSGSAVICGASPAGRCSTATATSRSWPKSSSLAVLLRQRWERCSAATTRACSLRRSDRPLVPSLAGLDHAQWRIGQCDGAILLDDAHAGAHQTTAGAAAAQPRLNDFAFGMDCITREDRVLDIELHVEEGKPGVLHCRLHQ